MGPGGGNGHLRICFFGQGFDNSHLRLQCYNAQPNTDEPKAFQVPFTINGEEAREYSLLK